MTRCGTGGFLIDACRVHPARNSTEPQKCPIYGEERLEKRDQSIKEAKKDIRRCRPTERSGRKSPQLGALGEVHYGIDVSRQMMRIAMMNLVLHGIRQANVKRANTLSDRAALLRTI